MLQKWKSILKNWINCYFKNVNSSTEECISKESLLTIISHLHKNLNLDDSSILEAQTVEGFILEKYPEFKFENGTVKPSSDDDVYAAASLLLLFVCVNSKDVDIKQAMCSKLSAEDQETIMKFSKALLGCSGVTYPDVQAAIAEACGQDAATTAESPPPTPVVAETPPALRSLHGEVRRLQAALDAERFDRNYLQEELARNNLKMDKLLKDKEQYKFEIMALKSKISLCCGQEAESKNPDSATETAARLTRQLNETEERLVATQEVLGDVQEERDGLKAKIEELKRERDKWLSETQSESTRAGRLADALESERNRVIALQELVAELRLHNNNNGGLDGSQLECDDPDSSGIALHNASVCSEACVNVIEVQLAEEKAKVAQLTYQLTTLQDQIANLTQTAESEKLALENVMSEKNSDIANLKHRVNEEIDEKNNLKVYYNDVVSKLSSEIIELEHKLKENSQASRTAIEQKMHEIQVLQEEKLSLLQSLSDETTKLEEIIKHLKTDIDTEKYLKVQMRENYENQLMKLNEKVGNRNNELVELQNKIFEKGEMIEQLEIELKKQKEVNNDLSNKHNEEIVRLSEDKQALERVIGEKIEELNELHRINNELSLKHIDELSRLAAERDDIKSALQQKTDEANELQKRINDISNKYNIEIAQITEGKLAVQDALEKKMEEANKLQKRLIQNVTVFDELNKEIDDLKVINVQLTDNYKELERSRNALQEEITQRENDVDATRKELENITNIFAEEKDKFVLNCDEKNATIAALQMRLHEEIQYKTDLEKELHNLHEMKSALTEQVVQLNQDLKAYQIEMQEKDRTIYTLDLYLKEEKHVSKTLRTDIEKLNEDISKLTEEISQKNNSLVCLEQQLGNENLRFQEELIKKDDDLDMMSSKLQEQCQENEELQNMVALLQEEKDRITKDLDGKCEDLAKLQAEYEKLCQSAQDNIKVIETLGSKIETQTQKYAELEKDFDSQTSSLITKLNETEKHIKEINSKSKNKDLKIQTLQLQVEKLNNAINDERSNLDKVIREKEVLLEKLDKEIAFKNRVENEYQKQCAALDNITSQLSGEINEKANEITALKSELDSISKEVSKKSEELKVLKEKLLQANEVENQNKAEISQLKTQVEKLQYQENELKKDIAVKTETINALHKENVQLHFTIEEDNSNQEVLLKEKDDFIEGLENNLNSIKTSLESLQRDYEETTLKWERTKVDMKNKIENQDKEIERLKDHIKELKFSIEEQTIEAEKIQKTLRQEIEDMIQSNNEEEKAWEVLRNEYEMIVYEAGVSRDALQTDLNSERAAKQTLELAQQDIQKQNETLVNEVVQLKSLIATLETERETNTRLYTQQLTEIQSFKETLEEEVKTISIKNESLQRLVNEMESKEKELTEERDRLIEEINALKSEKTTLISVKQNIERQLDEANDFIEKLSKENEELMQQLQSIEEEKQKLVAAKEAMKNELIASTEALKTLDTEIQTMEQEKNSLLEERNEFYNRLESLQRDMLELEQRLVSQNVQTNDVITQKANVAKLLEQAEKEKAILEEAYQALQKELSDKIAEEKSLIEQNGSLQRQLNEIQSEKAMLLSQKQAVEQDLFEESAAKAAILEDKDTLAQQLESLKDCLEKEMGILEDEKLAVDQQLSEEIARNKAISDENHQLVMRLESENQTLQQQFEATKEKEIALQAEKRSVEAQLNSIKQNMDREREVLLTKINEQEITYKQLSEDRVKLMKDLIEEKNAFKQLELELNDLKLKKDDLDETVAKIKTSKKKIEEKRDELLEQEQELVKSLKRSEQKVAEQFEEITSLNKEISRLNAEAIEQNTEKYRLSKENQNLLTENSSLKHDIVQLNAIAEILTSDKEELNTEKERLIQYNTTEKAALDELKVEKDVVSLTLTELSEKYAEITSELKQVKMDNKKHEDVSIEITSVLNSGIDLLLQSINKANIGNEISHKLMKEQKDGMSLGERCDHIVNIAQTLCTELSLRKDVEKALENEKIVVNELKSVVKEKDTQVKRLQESLKGEENERTKRTENYNATLEAKIKDIQSLQHENKTLNTELNEVKIQLETKVHSLQEKLTHNEDLTEKLKQTYECQIENLNVMVTKLTSYLKEKTVELESVRKEKQKMQHVVEENARVIKSLEDEINTQKANQETLTSEFNSERLVLKNMVAVTESVMEDQKLTYNNIISEHEKTIEILNEEKRDLEQRIEITQKKYEAIIEEKQCAFDALFKDLADMRIEKETLIKELEIQKERFTEEIAESKEQLDLKTKDSELLVQQNEILKKEETEFENKVALEREKFELEKEKFESEKEKFVKEIEDLQTQLKDKEANMELDKEKYELEKTKFVKQIEDLQTQVKDKEASKELDKEKFELETEKYELEKEKFVKEIEDLQTQMKDKEASKEQDKGKFELEKEKYELKKQKFVKEIEDLQTQMKDKEASIEAVEIKNKELTASVHQLEDALLCLQEKETEHKTKMTSLETELLNSIEKLTEVLSDDTENNDKVKFSLQEKIQDNATIQEKLVILTEEVTRLVKEKNDFVWKLEEATTKYEDQIRDLKQANDNLTRATEDNKAVIGNLEQLIQKSRKDEASEMLNLDNRLALLQEYQSKAEKLLQERETEIASLKAHISSEQELERKIDQLQEELDYKNTVITSIAEGKDEVINTLAQELTAEKAAKEMLQKELHRKAATLYELRQKLEDARALEGMRKESDDMLRPMGQRETVSAAGGESVAHQELKHLMDQVSPPYLNPHTSDLASSLDSTPNQTIADLERILQSKNRTITTLQTDITYLKSLMADSENKLLDITKELEMSKENCQQLSIQLKKIVHQKNEEISELKNKISKMSVTENRATQIIKVSAKYQAIILKRIAEIKSNTILKELTNFGNSANVDSELKKNLNTGAITLEDLENFLETTDRHLKRCTEKQLVLQKERDRLIEVNRINESEIINLKKFLTELSVSFKTFSSIKDLYTQKLSRIVSIQRTLRREILSLDSQVTDSVLCKLERSYAAVMQDLCECTMNLERWVERSISRTISTEKIKQAFTSDSERTSIATTSFQNASLEVQLDELQNSFEKLLEEVVRAQKGEAPKDTQASTVMEVRAEYEDKLNRMKAKMKQLYQEQIQVFKDKQKEEIATLEQELVKTRKRLEDTSRAYEDHIKALTTELWSVGEKFLMKKDEAEWLRKRQKSGSLMSLQHVHSTGLSSHREEPHPRLADADSNSLRSLPVTRGNKESRGLHMSDEEGEVFDNRWLKELDTPKRGPSSGQRLSELKWRNSLCPPHLKSSYPAETQFQHQVDEDDIKFANKSGRATIGGVGARKEVGITAYKKPGPPTPSKQAGRLSATDSELRELGAAPVTRKTSTPSRLRALFRPNKDTLESTPRKRLSNIFRSKK